MSVCIVFSVVACDENNSNEQDDITLEEDTDNGEENTDEEQIFFPVISTYSTSYTVEDVLYRFILEVEPSISLVDIHLVYEGKSVFYFGATTEEENEYCIDGTNFRFKLYEDRITITSLDSINGLVVPYFCFEGNYTVNDNNIILNSDGTATFDGVSAKFYPWNGNKVIVIKDGEQTGIIYEFDNFNLKFYANAYNVDDFTTMNGTNKMLVQTEDSCFVGGVLCYNDDNGYIEYMENDYKSVYFGKTCLNHDYVTIILDKGLATEERLKLQKLDDYYFDKATKFKEKVGENVVIVYEDDTAYVKEQDYVYNLYYKTFDEIFYTFYDRRNDVYRVYDRATLELVSLVYGEYEGIGGGKYIKEAGEGGTSIYVIESKNKIYMQRGNKICDVKTYQKKSYNEKIYYVDDYAFYVDGDEYYQDFSQYDTIKTLDKILSITITESNVYFGDNCIVECYNYVDGEQNKAIIFAYEKVKRDNLNDVYAYIKVKAIIDGNYEIKDDNDENNVGGKIITVNYLYVDQCTVVLNSENEVINVISDE